MNQTGLSTTRWLDAIWKPNIHMNTLPNGMDTLDLTGDGDARLIIVDLGSNIMDNVKLRIFRGADQIIELTMMNDPCAVIGFHTENDEKNSATVAIGISSSIFIFKNLRPHFKFCLPQLIIYEKEQDIWYKASMEFKLNIRCFVINLKKLLKERGTSYISSRTLKFLSLQKDLQQHFFKEFRKFPVTKINIVIIMGVIHRDSWSEIASSNLIVGTEFGELLILDHRGFFVIDKYTIGWPPMAITSSGLWTGDGQIVLVGREGQIGAIKRGKNFETWKNLSAPAVAVTSLCSEEIAVVMMNGSFILLSNKGIKLWKVQLPGNPLDMDRMFVSKNGLSLLAISIAGMGIRIYNQKHHIDTIKSLETVSTLKYGRLGQEERSMIMITCSGGLNIKILKRTAEFNQNSYLQTSYNLFNNINQFIVPKKSKLFIEQTIRERSKFINIHKIFQQGFLRLRLNIATRIQKLQSFKDKSSIVSNTLQSSMYGLGPDYIMKIYITSVLENFFTEKIFLICRSNHLLFKPKLINWTSLDTNVSIPIILNIRIKSALSNKIQILLCYKGQIKPLSVMNIIFPVTQNEVQF